MKSYTISIEPDEDTHDPLARDLLYMVVIRDSDRIVGLPLRGVLRQRALLSLTAIRRAYEIGFTEALHQARIYAP